MYHQFGKSGYDLVAGRIGFRAQQGFIVVGHASWNLKFHLWQYRPIHGSCLCVYFSHYVEDDAVVVGILVVPVPVPVTGLVVNLHIAHPQRMVDFHLRIEEVWTGVHVVQPRIDDLNTAAVCSGELSQLK